MPIVPFLPCWRASRADVISGRWAAGLLLLLAGCAAPGAEITGKAGGVSLGETDAVFFGGPFVVITSSDLTCEDLAFIRQNYEDGVAPYEADIGVLQLTWVAGEVTPGLKQIAPDASVTAKVLSISDDVFVESDASAGSVTIDVVKADERVEGTLAGVTFEDGTLAGSFVAEWCLNLREW